MFKFIPISTDSQCIQLEYHRLTFKQRIKVFDCLNLESLDFFYTEIDGNSCYNEDGCLHQQFVFGCA
ncbi:hypothetical protein HanIR_Chr05g0240251 [Helianthus annuus]|nr:hypothetical protein HanIR_Chr05g0240251 [Helianthus annuus]